jgi:hypothetical protein
MKERKEGRKQRKKKEGREEGEKKSWRKKLLICQKESRVGTSCLIHVCIK